MPHASPSARLQSLLAAQRELAGPGADLDRRLTVACERAMELTCAIGAAAAVRDGDELEYRAASGAVRELLGLRVDTSRSFPGQCLIAVQVVQAEVRSGSPGETAMLHRLGARARNTVPFSAAGFPRGVLEIYADETLAIDGDDRAALELLAGFLASAIEASERAELAASVISLSRTDKLTGLLNRQAGEEAIERELERAIRYGRPLSFVLLEVDQLKLVNDAAGHAGGDRVLAELGRLIARRLRSMDLGIRFGGEEFLLVVPETDLLGAQDLAEAVRNMVEQSSFELPVPITISGGAATRAPGERAEQTIARATERLAWAKSAGRNRVAV